MNESIINVSDTQCHVCHEKQFPTFDNGHPEFSAYPAMRRTRIIFDHVSHLEKHFKESDLAESEPAAEFGCNRCHVPDAKDETILVNDFENACQACHESKITGEGRASAKGIAVLTVPDIDVETLVEKGRLIGQWPEFTDVGLTPFMSLFLSTNPEFQRLSDSLSSLDLTDLTNASDAQLDDVETLVWMVKRFYYQLSSLGSDALVEAITGNADNFSDSSFDGVGLLAALSPDVVDSSVNAWFPDLLDEYQQFARGALKPVAIEKVIETEEMETVVIEDNSESSLQPADDDILSEDADILSEDGDILSEDGDILAEDGDILSEDGDILSEDGDILSEDGDILSEDGDILSEDGDTLTEDGDILSEDDDILSEDGDILSEDGDLTAEERGLDGDDGNSTSNDKAKLLGDVAARPLPIEDRANAGGWYREEFQIRYRPTDHADRFLKAWLDFGAISKNDDVAKVFGMLSGDNSPGNCLYCHSVDATETGTIVNWTGAVPTLNLRRFTPFSHVAHVGLVNQEGCVTCHGLNKEADYMAAFEHRDVTRFESGFNDIDKATCAGCHNEEKTQQNCLTCHDYHVGEFPAGYEELGRKTGNMQ